MNKLAMPTLFQDNIITFPKAKPFLKWAGGKSQLIDALEERLPKSILNSRTIEVYVEPFVGGGAFFFYLKSNYVIKKAYLFDINKDLIVAYKVVQVYPHALIERLLSIEKEYLSLSEDEQRKFFYEIRYLYNSQKKLKRSIYRCRKMSKGSFSTRLDICTTVKRKNSIFRI